MAARKYRIQSNAEVRPSWRIRLVQDEDTPVASPVLALQQALLRASVAPAEPYERYPLAFRVGFPILSSLAIWYIVFSVV